MDEFGNYDRALSAADIEAICIEEHNGEPFAVANYRAQRDAFQASDKTLFPTEKRLIICCVTFSIPASLADSQ